MQLGGQKPNIPLGGAQGNPESLTAHLVSCHGAWGQGPKDLQGPSSLAACRQAAGDPRQLSSSPGVILGAVLQAGSRGGVLRRASGRAESPSSVGASWQAVEELRNLGAW